MAERLLDGALGGVQESIGASDSRAQAFAAAVRPDLTSSDPDVAAKTAVFFENQAGVLHVQRRNLDTESEFSETERVRKLTYRRRPRLCRTPDKTAFFLALMTLAGCAPYPLLPGPRMTSRSNVPAEVPSWLGVGQTTRQEVLTAFGQPDWVGTDNRSVTYCSAYGQGGVGVADPGTNSLGYVGCETREFRRLLISFGETHVVSGVKLAKMNCPWWRASGIDRSYKMNFMRPVHVPCDLGEFPFGDLESAVSN